MVGEWRRTTFAELIAEGALEIGDGYRARNDELGGDGLIFLRAGHVTDTHIDFAGVDRFRLGVESRLASKLAEPGDAIITTKGNSTGRTAYVSPSMPRFVYSPHLSYWRSRKPERIAPGFLRYWSRGPEFSIQLAGMKASTDMAPYLSLVDQKRLRITLPPIAVQRVIAETLGAMDDKIDLNRRMNETLEATARAIFKSWFVDFDPVRTRMEGRASATPVGFADLLPHALSESPIGKMPEGWVLRPLDTVAQFLNGLALQKYPAGPEGGLPVIKIRELNQGSTNGADLASIAVAPEYIIDDGDVLFSWSGSLVVKLWSGGKGALNQHLFKVTSRTYPQWFYLGWLLEYLPHFQHIAAAKATTMGHIQRHHLTEALVPVPPQEKLLAIATEVFEPMMKKRLNNDVESRSLASLRDVLLPKLLSGELRTGQAEHAVVAAM